MALAGTVLVALALLVGALNGFRRGTAREGMALVGVLLGTLLVLLWTDRWGAVVARRTGWQPGTGQWLAAMILLWGTALLAGYGSGVLLPRRQDRLPAVWRGVGALMGLLNGGLLIGFTLRFTQSLLYGETAQARKATWIRSGIASNFLLDRLDLILLSIAWTVSVVSLIATLTSLVRRLLRPQPAPPAWPAAAKPSSPAPVFGAAPSTQTASAPGMERSFIDKPPTGGSA